MSCTAPGAEPAAALVRRRFADLPGGQIHYREAAAGRGEPVLLVHAGPGSARQLEGLIAGLAGGHHVIAPDTPGNGDSSALPEPTIGDLAAALQAFIEALDLPRVHVWGSHTGAAIATELALRAPARVRSLALEGVGHFDAETRAELLAHYTPDLSPDLDGTHLLRAFQFCRDQALFFPWYRRTAAARRATGLPPAEDLHALVLEVLKAPASCATNYRAAFRWDAAARLPQLRCPLLLMAGRDDPLHEATRQLAGTIRQPFVDLPRADTGGLAAARLAALDALFARA